MQVKSGFLTHWLASLEKNSTYYLAPSDQWDKIVHQEFNFWPFFGILEK